MSSQLLEIISSWISAIGTTIGAIGQTKQLAERRYIGQHLWTIGKGVQGLGAALQAIAEEEEPVAEVGNWLISIGSSSVSVVGARGLPNELKKEIEERKGISNLDPKTIEELENIQVAIIGNALQTIGAYLVAIKREHPKRFLGGII